MHHSRQEMSRLVPCQIDPAFVHPVKKADIASNKARRLRRLVDRELQIGDYPRHTDNKANIVFDAFLFTADGEGDRVGGMIGDLRPIAVPGGIEVGGAEAVDQRCCALRDIR